MPSEFVLVLLLTKNSPLIPSALKKSPLFRVFLKEFLESDNDSINTAEIMHDLLTDQSLPWKVDKSSK